MKRQFLKFLVLLGFILLPIGALHAADTKTGNSIYVSKDEIINGNLYAAGNSITIDGTISGDLIVVGQTINVNGRVEGDIIAAGQTINVNGEVGGNIRIAGSSVSINNSVSRNVNIIGNNVVLGPNTKVGWDAYLIGFSAEIRGVISGNLNGQVNQALIAAKIGKNVGLDLKNSTEGQFLTIAPDAVINGDLAYTSSNKADISDKASVAGKTQQKLPETPQVSPWLWLWTKLYAIFAALVVGLVLIFIGTNISTKILENLNSGGVKNLLPGLVILFIMPPIALVLLFTIIGVPLSFIIIALWLIMLYVAKIFTAIYIGQFIIKKITTKNDWPLIWPLILGVIICWFLFIIPFIGWLLSLLAIIFGLGGLWSYFRPQIKNL